MKKHWTGLRRQVFAHALFFATAFALVGQLLVSYRFISPIEPSAPVAPILITATGSKTDRAQNAEVWFYGAFDVDTNAKISDGDLIIGPTWERRQGVYISHRNQPDIIMVRYKNPIQLSFGTHPYSGLVTIGWGSYLKKIDLYSSRSGQLNVLVDQSPTFTQSPIHFLIVSLFAALVALIGAGHVALEWRRTYCCFFAAMLLSAAYLTFAAYFPGVYTPDSADQLGQALKNDYHDWHPPLMAWLWRSLITLTGREESLLVFHLLLLTAGAIYWAKVFVRLKAGVLSFAIPLFLLSPVFVNFSGVLWKDVGYAFSLFLATGIAALIVVECQVSLFRCLLGVSLVFYAFGVRSNGLFAIIPFMFSTTFLLASRWKLNKSRLVLSVTSGLGSLLFVVLLAVGTNAFTYMSLNSEHRYPFQYNELYDIAGVSSRSGEDYFPDFITDDPFHNMETIRQAYSKSISTIGSANNLLFIGSDGARPMIPMNTNATLQQELRNGWAKAVTQQPVAYIKHRFAVFNFLMGRGFYATERPQSRVDRTTVLLADPLISSTPAAEIKISTAMDSHIPGAEHSRVLIQNILSTARDSFLYVGWFWLALLVCVFAYAASHIKDGDSNALAVMMSGSGLLYIFPYMLVAPAADFRYLYWACISGVISLLLSLASVTARVFTPLLNTRSREPDRRRFF